jgi:two-component system, sensor histidine kinase YesM
MRQKTIKKRLLWSMIGISIIPIIAISMFTFSYLSQNLKREFMLTNETKIAWANQYADTVIQQIHDSLYGLRINQTLLSAMNFSDPSELQKKKYIIDTLNQTLYSNANIINEIMLYDNQSENLSVLNYRSGGTFSNEVVDQTVFSALKNEPQGLMFSKYRGNIYAIQSINRFEDQVFLGAIAFRLNQEVTSVLDEILGSKDGHYYLISGNHSFIGIEPKENEIEDMLFLNDYTLKSSNIYNDLFNEQFLWATKTSRNELTIIKTVPIEVFNQAYRPVQLITIGIAMMTLGISVLLSYVISNKISKPISRIIRKMQQAPLDEIRVKADHYDEIAQLERVYNEMTEAIKKLIIEKYKKNLELKTAQLKALQSQMNPHFLNNTFQLIGGMALSIQANNIYEVTSSMGEMMKYALTKEQDLVTLSEEIRHTENYLEIQRQRFSNRVQTNIKVDASALEFLIPKYTLQPLVENSFKHGFKLIDQAWKINIEIKVDEHIILTITDNGIGMTEEKAKIINDQLEQMQNQISVIDEMESTGIGLSNIHQRIQLLFGTKYGLHVTSLKQGGTKILVTFPKKIEGGDIHV